MPALGGGSSSSPATAARKKSSAVNLRGSYGGGGTGTSASALQAASEQTCRALRAYRARLAEEVGGAGVAPEILAELEAELRLTEGAVAERESRAAAARVPVTEPVLRGLLDRYSERLVDMLDEKLRLRLGGRREREGNTEGAGGLEGVESGLAMMRLGDAEDGDGPRRPVTAHGTPPPPVRG